MLAWPRLTARPGMPALDRSTRVYKVAQQLWLERNGAQGSLQEQEQQQKLAATSCNSSTHKTSDHIVIR